SRRHSPPPPRPSSLPPSRPRGGRPPPPPPPPPRPRSHEGNPQVQTITARELSPGDRVYLPPREWGVATILTAAPKNNGTEMYITYRRDEPNSRGSSYLASDMAVDVAPRGEILQVWHAVHESGYTAALYRAVDTYIRVAISPYVPGQTGLFYCTKREAEELADHIEAKWTRAGTLKFSHRHPDF
ncbi:hypothetical protein, partial [Nocardia abscessus]|uniref:hypothetical protein n=1 Tax=Nocardia abscessus TaxID=120957 RepID=UPI002453AD5C